MKVIKRIRRVLICILLVIFQLTGCSAINGDIKKENKDQLIFGTTLSTKSLDPSNGYCGWFLVRYGIGETLFKLDENMKVKPWLASGYEQLDNNTWKIGIKENIKFQNGNKLSATSVKNSIERTLQMNSRAVDTLKIKDIVVEENNIIITTSQENPTLINDLCDPFVAIIDVNEENIDTNPIGTGPFKVKKFNPSGASYFIKNNNYWEEDVKLSSIKVISINDADTLAMALQSGEIDVAQGLSYSMVNLFEKDSNYKIRSTDTSRAMVMYFNERNKALQNIQVRKAINMLIDKEVYCKSILKNQATPLSGPFPSNTSYSIENIHSQYNPKEAIEILKSQGYEDTNNDGILDKDGENLVLKLVTYSSRAELPSIAQVIQNDLKNIGIEVKIEISDNIMDILESGDFDIALYSNITSATGDALAYLNNAMSTSGSSNYGNYSNEKVDLLINKLKSKFDKEERDKLSREIQEIVLNDDAYNFIASMKMSFVMKNNVIGIDPHPTDYYQFNANTALK